MYIAMVMQAVHKMVQQFQDRNRQALRAPGGWGSQNFYKTAYEDGKVVRPAALIPQEIQLVPISVRGWVDSRAIMRPEGLSQWKIPKIPSGIEPATCWIEANCLNQLRQRVPRRLYTGYHNTYW